VSSQSKWSLPLTQYWVHLKRFVWWRHTPGESKGCKRWAPPTLSKQDYHRQLSGFDSAFVAVDALKESRHVCTPCVPEPLLSILIFCMMRHGARVSSGQRLVTCVLSPIPPSAPSPVSPSSGVARPPSPMPPAELRMALHSRESIVTRARVYAQRTKPRGRRWMQHEIHRKQLEKIR